MGEPEPRPRPLRSRRRKREEEKREDKAVTETSMNPCTYKRCPLDVKPSKVYGHPSKSKFKDPLGTFTVTTDEINLSTCALIPRGCLPSVVSPGFKYHLDLQVT